jgi:hypothetical protein
MSACSATCRRRRSATLPISAQCLDFLEANRALEASFVLEFKQSTFRNLGPTETEHPRRCRRRLPLLNRSCQRSPGRAAETADRGVRFIKVRRAALLLDPRQTSIDIHPSDLSDLLGCRIDLIAEKIEGERAVVDLLDYDVRFGQGFLFAPPRPLRPEGASATGGATSNKASESNGSNTTGYDCPDRQPGRRASPRASGSRAGAPRRRTGQPAPDVATTLGSSKAARPCGRRGGDPSDIWGVGNGLRPSRSLRGAQHLSPARRHRHPDHQRAATRRSCSGNAKARRRR